MELNSVPVLYKFNSLQQYAVKFFVRNFTLTLNN